MGKVLKDLTFMNRHHLDVSKKYLFLLKIQSKTIAQFSENNLHRNIKQNEVY
jgi:hypothetical protein